MAVQAEFLSHVDPNHAFHVHKIKNPIDSPDSRVIFGYKPSGNACKFQGRGIGRSPRELADQSQIDMI